MWFVSGFVMFLRNIVPKQRTTQEGLGQAPSTQVIGFTRAKSLLFGYLNP